MDNEIFDKSRVINFIDAVFSIAVTLLVLDIAIPTYSEMKQYNTLEILSRRIPSFIGLFISFMVIILYWVGHLRVMKFVKDMTNKLLWFNVFMLLFIVLLPFSTAFYVMGFNMEGPFAFYCFNLSAIGLFNFLITNYIVNREKENPNMTQPLAKYLKLRAINALTIWILAGVVAFIFPYIARFLFVLIFIFEIILNRWYKKQLKKEAIVVD